MVGGWIGSAGKRRSVPTGPVRAWQHFPSLAVVAHSLCQLSAPGSGSTPGEGCPQAQHRQFDVDAAVIIVTLEIHV